MVLTKKVGLWTAVVASLTAFVTLYYIFDPTQTRWMPQCPTKFLIGIDCPACGAQRALHAILHGDIAGAFRFNPFLLIGLSYLLLALWGRFHRLPGSGLAWRIAHNKITVIAYILLFFGWWILRNIQH